jgi:hypothetical protein
LIILLSHLFNNSGSGKTRLSLEGLCHHWGFYISCRSKEAATSGSGDFEEAIAILKKTSTWNREESANHFQQNSDAADRVFAMLLCARFFVLEKFVDCTSSQTNVTDARRRWVLIQAMPPIHKFTGTDIFVKILRNLRYADTDVMLDIVRDTFCNIARKRPDLFSDDTSLFAVLDDTQAAANLLVGCCPSTTNTSTLHPVLHNLYRFLCDSKLFAGFIISGTALSTGIVKSSLSSIVGRAMTSRRGTIVFTGDGVVSDKSEQEGLHQTLSHTF